MNPKFQLNKTEIIRQPVWSGLLRISHWLIALGCVAMLISAAMVRHAPALAEAARDWHLMIGQVLLFPLLLRLWLLLAGKGADGWRDCIPSGQYRVAMLDMLKFYLSLGRWPLPRWYAHNPLWGPVYLLFFAVLALTLLTGWMLMRGSVDGWVVLTHGFGAGFILLFSVAHVVSVFWHDAKGTSSDISAMVNGSRILVPEESPGPAGPVSVSLDEFGKGR